MRECQVNAKWLPYMMTGIARRSCHSGVCSFTDLSQLSAGLCQQVGDMPAAPAEPEAAASVPAEVGSLYDCLNRMLRASHIA